MINQIEHNEVKSSQISENEIVGSKDSSGTIIQLVLILLYYYTPQLHTSCYINGYTSSHHYLLPYSIIDLIKVDTTYLRTVILTASCYRYTSTAIIIHAINNRTK